MIAGAKLTLLKRYKVNDTPCPHCGERYQFEAQVYGAYSHVLGIPFLPKYKIRAAECQRCESRWYEKNIPYAHHFFLADDLKQNSRFKLYHYTGFIMLLAFIFAVVMAINEGSNAKKNGDKPRITAARLAHGDILNLKFSDNEYTTWMVSRLSADTVFVFENTKQTNKKSGLYDIDEPLSYTKQETWFYTYEIDSMISNKTIFRVDKLPYIINTNNQSNE